MKPDETVCHKCNQPMTDEGFKYTCKKCNVTVIDMNSKYTICPICNQKAVRLWHWISKGKTACWSCSVKGKMI